MLERGGSDNKIGIPAAFIKTAWRRYTKHSRNKAQEIQGALEPLAETHRNVGPFKGAILAGVFTSGALAQLRSLGFTVIYFPYDSIVATFRRFGIDASYDETTLDAQFDRKIKAYSRLSGRRKARLAAALIGEHRSQVDQFLDTLAKTVARQIERIIILASTARRVKSRPSTMPSISSRVTMTMEAPSPSNGTRSTCATTTATS